MTTLVSTFTQHAQQPVQGPELHDYKQQIVFQDMSHDFILASNMVLSI